MKEVKEIKNEELLKLLFKIKQSLQATKNILKAMQPIIEPKIFLNLIEDIEDTLADIKTLITKILERRGQNGL
ncbi:hypothetical protein [Thermodesulfovibrio yellowstonii]|uniref:hypothetical protein n=1 Tax=Thermodesulfovibrio yellowstonii TaxID=28262 RepID=UPI00040E51FA|nr:hypothetical protein [Thermodesulfovibrio islandicus]